jgi:hypothetical protein
MTMLLLVLFCFVVSCYANGIANHDAIMEKNNENRKQFNERMKLAKEKYQASQKSHDHPPTMINNVTVSLSKTSVYQGETIDISFTTASGEFPSVNDMIIFTYDDVEFNSSYIDDWSLPDGTPYLLGDLWRSNPSTGEYEKMYNDETGVLTGFLLAYYPRNFKAVLYQTSYGIFDFEATNILGVSDTFEIKENEMSIVATQNKRLVSFDVKASAPISTYDYWFVVILAQEVVPNTMSRTVYYEDWKLRYNRTSFLPDELEGVMEGTFGGWDRDWPKGEYKLVMFVDTPMWSTENMYHLAVSNTFSVQKTVCRLNKQTCSKTADCCGDDFLNLSICKKIKKTRFFGIIVTTVKQCAPKEW